MRIIILSLAFNYLNTMLHLKKLLAGLAAVMIFTGCITKTSHQDTEKKEEGFSKRDGAGKAIQQEFIMTQDPALGYIPKERLISAIQYQNDLIASRQFRTQQAITWQERGPNNIAGRTRAVFIDSRDGTGNTVYAASVSGGIWKANSFKSATPTWTPLAENMGSIAVCALAQDPSNPNTMYAGTGEGWFNTDAVRGNGIWKSADGGGTWVKLASTDSTATLPPSTTLSLHNFDFIQDIVVNSAGVIFTSSRPSRFCNTGGIFRSADGGSSWARVIGTLMPLPPNEPRPCDSAYNYYGADLEIASNGDVYATTGYFNNGEINLQGRIWRSGAAANGANVGASGTWTEITPSGGPWQRIEIATSQSNASVIYAALQGQGNGVAAIKKSINSGASWTDLAMPIWCNQGSTSSDFTNGQAFYDLIIQVDPTNENNVVLGGIDLFRSTNGGTSWSQITQWANGCSGLPTIHADQHNVIFYPGSGTEMIATNDGGVYYSANAGSSWATFTGPNLNGANQTTYSSKNTGYNVTQFYSCDVHPIQTNYFLAGTQDNGTQRFNSAGINATVEASVGGDGGFCHIDQVDGNIQVLSYVYNNYYYSRNGGASFQRAFFNNSGFFINPSEYDDSRKVLYTSSGWGQLGVVNNLAGTGAPTIANLSVSAAIGNRTISAIKYDPTVSGGGTIWIASFDSTGTLKPSIVKLTNASTTPTAVVNTSLTAAPTGAYVSSIDINPANSNHILITLSNYGIVSVYESTDGGNSFVDIEGNLPDVPVRWGMFVPTNASVSGTIGGGILLATEIGVWFAQTTGAPTVWTPQNTGLPNVRTDMLRYRPADNLVAAATHGRGLFTTTLTSIATGIPSVPNTKNFIDYVTANQQQLFVKVGNLTTTKMDLQLFDMKGRLVYSSKTAYSNQSIPIDQLADGSYILKVYGNRREQYTKQFIK